MNRFVLGSNKGTCDEASEDACYMPPDVVVTTGLDTDSAAPVSDVYSVQTNICPISHSVSG